MRTARRRDLVGVFRMRGVALAFSALLVLVALPAWTATPVAFSDFANPKRVGIDPIHVGEDTIILGFDLTPEGSSIASGTIIDSSFSSIGVELSATLTSGPHAGQSAQVQALDSTTAPNWPPQTQVAISPPDVLSAVNPDPNFGPTYTGEVAGTATLVVT